MGLEDVPRCQHVKINGTQCGSPALRSRRLCYFHDKIRHERAKIAASTAARFDLPLLEDANSVQVALMKVIQMLGSGTLDHKTAGLMLYALQTASINLRYVDLEADEVTDVVIDRDTVAATSIDGPQWFEEDFESASEEDEEEGEEDEEEAAEGEDDEENEAEAAAGAEEPAHTVQANAQSAPKPPAKKEAPARKGVKEVTLEEARKQVQAVARDWLSGTLAQKSQ